MQTKIPIFGILNSLVPTAALALLSSITANAADYQSAVLSDGPLAYYRLNDTPPPDVAKNSGSLGAAGNGIHGPGVLHRVPGALVASGNAAAAYSGTGGATHTYVPYQAALNPAANQPFTIEFWANPSVEVTDAPGPCPLFNRVSSGNRSGWVFFQRSPTTGWNFRMYNGSGSNLGIDLSGGSNAQGTWSHVVAVWDGAQARLYVNGVLVAGPTTPTGGYNASTAAIFSVGSYDDGVQNPFSGSIDEVAFYQTALSAAQVLAHYNNATSALPLLPYSTVVTTDGAVEYLRLDEPNPNVNVAVNTGTLGPAGDGTHFPGAFHQVPGALAGNSDTAMGYWAIDSSSQDGGVPTVIPFNAALNPAGSFTIEYWIKPTVDGNAGNAQCPMFNRDPADSSPNRMGWDFFQRPSGTGWNFRMFNGDAHNKVFDITGGPYTVGAWNHLVAVYNASIPSAALYLNGVQVAQSITPNGAFNPNVSAPLSIGGYSDGSQNPFIGSIDEVAIYGTALSAAQVLTHYQNGTNPSRPLPYETLVANDGAVEYLRQDEPARAVAANIGTLSTALNATYVNNSNSLAGPQAPAFTGFEASNQAADFNGTTSYLELGNPASLNFGGQITLEAWVQPAAAQNPEAYIIAHGYNDSGTAEDVLRIENGVYQIQSYNGAGHGASFTVPPEDLGSGNWVHLVGTYDGANWNLYRNGIQVATAADATGALPVINANWAVGARGKWKYASGFPATGEDRVWTGGIDEPAIYNYALSPARVAAHYSAGLYGAHPLTIAKSGGNVTLTWPAGTLQQASVVTGPYTDLPSAVSPYLVPAAGAKFYRVRFQ